MSGLPFISRYGTLEAMGLLNILNDLFDENSDNSFEKKLTSAIDQVEGKLSQTLDKAETGVKAASQAMDKLEKGVDRVDVHTSKAIDIIQK